MAGQARIRVRYLDLATSWFGYLFVSRGELWSSCVARAGSSLT